MERFKGIFALLLVSSLALAGCGAGTVVSIKQGMYNPAIETANLGAYKGKLVYFPSVTNEANDTSIWDYYSVDKKYYYEATPSLQTYVWDCFVKAFNRIGVRASATPWGPDTPNVKELTIVLNSVTDQKFVFTATLNTLGKSPFQKQYTVEAEPTKSTDLKELEARSYRLIDSAFLTMVTDADFRKAFLKS
jgi:hypothetical protein